MAVEEAKKRNRKLPHVAPHGSPTDASQIAQISSDRDDALSISTFDKSHGKISPPDSPISKIKAPILLLTNGNSSDGFSIVQNKKKRSRAEFDFTALHTKRQPQPLNGIATTNHFQALQTMEVEIVVKDATADKRHGARKQIVPVNVKRPDAINTSSESAFFIEKHHTRKKKAAKVTSILEVTESMITDENTAQLDTLPDKFAEADETVPSMVKLIENATNPYHIVESAAACPLAFNSTLSLAMAGDGRLIGDLAQLHLINRVMSATYPNEDTTFLTKWMRIMGMAVPSNRHDVFKACARWWTHTDEVTELSRASKALGIFELALMSIAPILFKNDHWIQYLTGQPVEWIPAHHSHFLHPNTLLLLLRSDIGLLCMQQ
ncbi:hypothetical protein Plhal304r1_c041g0120031 [Plasmopara halstedii]